MRALIVTDMQKVITGYKEFEKETSNIHQMIDHFTKEKDLVIFTKHISTDPEDYFYHEKETTQVDYSLKSDHILLEKTTPSIFKETQLDDILKKHGVKELVIAGFNTEFCTLFSTIAAFDRGYEVTFVEDAIGSCNDAETYEMPGLDINDFVGSFLNWSGVVDVVDTDEYFENL